MNHIKERAEEVLTAMSIERHRAPTSVLSFSECVFVDDEEKVVPWG